MFDGLKTALAVLIVAAAEIYAQSPAIGPTSGGFEVATIKPTAPDWRGGAYFTMQGGHRFVVRNYTLKSLVGAAWDLPTRLISGGPTWVNGDHYDIVAETPGDIRRNVDEQMSMLRALLVDRFQLTFHREQKELPIYTLTVANSGSKIKKSDGQPPDGRPALVFRLFPERRALLPVRDATMAEFASVLQHGPVDRPVVDKTALSGRYDFDLDWAPNEDEFGGMMSARPPLSDDSAKPDLFAAVQQQLGLRLLATRGPVETFVIDKAEHPAEN
ncbi:MAG TPA: TIGR03435 family protein [Bryobacteraceae bacterium]|nr:TIGR03435 family protein [Bryobacteraceae bacterium]